MSLKNINSKGRGSGIEGGKGKGGRSREIKSKPTEERKQDLLKEGNASLGPSKASKRPSTDNSNEEEPKKRFTEDSPHFHTPVNEEPLEDANASRDRIPSTKKGRAKRSRKQK